MNNPFTLFDITNLMKSFKAASIYFDCLPPFLNSYDFESVYETDDNSLVFNAGGENELSIEFFNFNHPLQRKINIMYRENKEYVVLGHKDLTKIV